MGEADKTPTRQTVNYWVGITNAYNEDKRNYNGFIPVGDMSVFHGVEPALAAPYTTARLKKMWEETVERRKAALYKSKTIGSHRSFWDYCDGHIAALYMEKWLTIHSDRRETVTGLANEPARMTSESEQSMHASSGERPAKRRRPTTQERLLELLEQDRKEELEEREREREERKREQQVAEVHKDIDDLTCWSAAVEAATKALKALKDIYANGEQIEEAERLLNNLISRWRKYSDI